MILSPRQAVQTVNDKLEEWWERFVTPDVRQRQQHDNDDDDDILLNGMDDDDEEENATGARPAAGRRISLLVNKLFQEARFPRIIRRMPAGPLLLLPQQLLSQLLAQLVSSMPSREQLSAYYTQVYTQVDDRLQVLLLRLPTLLPSLPRRDQLPPAARLLPELSQLPSSIKDLVGEMAASCWDAVEATLDENTVVYKQGLKWSGFVVFYLLIMLLFSSQCCQTTTTNQQHHLSISRSTTGDGFPTTLSAASAVEAVYNPMQQQDQQLPKRREKQQPAQNNQQENENPAAAAATTTGQGSWFSWFFSSGKVRNSTAPSSSLVSTPTTARHDHLDGACASTSLSFSGGRANKKQHRNVTSSAENGSILNMPPPPPPPLRPPLWFTFVRQANTQQKPPPTLPPIARRMVKDVDGYYVEDDFEKRTVLPPPGGFFNRTSIKTAISTTTTTTRGGASYRNSMENVAAGMEEEREKEEKTVTTSGILYPAAFTFQPVLRKQDVGFLHAWSRRIISEIHDINERSRRVSWGGGVRSDDSTLWWQERLGRRTSYFSWWNTAASRSAVAAAKKDPLQDIDGGHLLYSYYQVLLPQFIKDPSKVTFPRHLNPDSNLCPEHGCSTQVAIRHTLEFRESYQPWRPTAAMVQENEHGWIYTRGLTKQTPPASGSASNTKDKSSNSISNKNVAMHDGQHAMIWARPGIHPIQDPLAYNRAILHALEQGVATSLKHSHGQVGKFNVVIDASGFEWSKLPDMAVMKQLVYVLQDHYPGRLGAIFMFNLSPSAFVYLKFVLKSLIDREVRQKIYLLSRNPTQRLAQLESVVDIKNIPDWIQGGQDAYEFNAKTYYASSPKTWRDEDIDRKKE
jgi:CRAL/TRIO domain